MNCGDFSEPIKSCLWLNSILFEIPLNLLTSPPLVICCIDNIKLRLITDLFEVYIAKSSESVIEIVVFRIRLNPNEEPDDGYALKFYFIISCFDEETQSAIMKYDDEKACASFRLTKNVLKRATSNPVLFDVFMVVQMLEFKSLDRNDPRKIPIDQWSSFVKSKLTKEKSEQLGCILKNPELDDVLTGRLPEWFTLKAMDSITFLYTNLTEIAEYFKAKYNDKDSRIPNFDANKLLNYIGFSFNEGPEHIAEALTQYLKAHIMGLDFLKIATSDYVVHMLDRDYNVVHILAVALVVQDEYLIEKAIPSFVSRFHEIDRSAMFGAFCARRIFHARLMFHAVRIWLSKHNEFIPEARLQNQLNYIIDS